MEERIHVREDREGLPKKCLSAETSKMNTRGERAKNILSRSNHMFKSCDREKRTVEKLSMTGIRKMWLKRHQPTRSQNNLGPHRYLDFILNHWNTGGTIRFAFWLSYKERIGGETPENYVFCNLEMTVFPLQIIRITFWASQNNL